MKKIELIGVFEQNNRIFTVNPPECKGIKIYNEKLITKNGTEYRSWNPFRSKLAAALLKGVKVDIKPDYNVLYLGAATGTTVSHISDLLTKGIMFAVENSPIAAKKLLTVTDKRKNIIPIFEDAFHPERYSYFLSAVDFLYQDISQRNQAEIFIENAKKFLKKNGSGLLMVKARSIDVALKPKQAYELVKQKLINAGIKVENITDLSPYEKDHASIAVSL